MGEFEVEEILNHKDIARSRQYFVSWIGYPSSENSWIREEDTNCEELLENYKEKIKQKKFKSKNLNQKMVVQNCDEIILSGKSIKEILEGFKNLEGTFYNVILSDGTTATLSNEDLKKIAPNLLMEYLEKGFFSGQKM